MSITITRTFDADLMEHSVNVDGVEVATVTKVDEFWSKMNTYQEFWSVKLNGKHFTIDYSEEEALADLNQFIIALLQRRGILTTPRPSNIDDFLEPEGERS